MVRNSIFVFCMSACELNMTTRNSRVLRGEKISYLTMNLPSSINFRSRMSFTRQRSRLIYEVIIWSMRRPYAESYSMSRLSRNMRLEVSGFLNSCVFFI